jgi:uncharacterized protein (TIGR02246 family)
MADNADERQIRALVENWAKAVREQDMAGVLARHTEDIVMFDVPPPVRSKGIAAYEKTWDLFFANSPGGEGAFDLSELEIQAGDTVAFCHALIDVVGSTARLTIGLRKVRGEWRIAHEHHSYPAASGNGDAAG